MKSTSKGLVKLELQEGSIEVQDVLQVPDLATNLSSVSRICKKGLSVIFTAETWEVRDEDGDVIASGMETGGLYRLNTKRPESSYLITESNIWHKRLGHLNQGSLRKLVAMVDGMDLKNELKVDCVACAKGKHARDSFHSSSSRAEGLLDLVHSDVCGPIEEASFGGNRFFVTFVDDASRKVFVYFLEPKSQVKDVFERFKAMTERQTGRKLKIVRSDNGMEYMVMKKTLERDGIIH